MPTLLMTLGETHLRITLEDNPTTRDLVSQLPLTLEFEDFHGIEKISYLPRKLSTEGAARGWDPQKGSLTYYAPWGNLAFFYQDFDYSTGLIPLGEAESGLEALEANETFTATLTLVE